MKIIKLLLLILPIGLVIGALRLINLFKVDYKVTAIQDTVFILKKVSALRKKITPTDSIMWRPDGYYKIILTCTVAGQKDLLRWISKRTCSWTNVTFYPSSK